MMKFLTSDIEAIRNRMRGELAAIHTACKKEKDGTELTRIKQLLQKTYHNTTYSQDYHIWLAMAVMGTPSKQTDNRAEAFRVEHLFDTCTRRN